MASDHPLPEIPWDKNKPAFFVTSELDPQHEGVRAVFTKPHIYHIGTSHYCGCGFSYSTDEDYEHIFGDLPDILAKALAENAEGRGNVRLLREYLDKAVEQGDVELYGSPGGSAAEPKCKKQVDPDYFTGEEAGIGEGEFLVVTRGLT